MQNQNWFNAMVEFRNTVRNIQSIYNVPRAIAKQIQDVAGRYQSQKACEEIVSASLELRTQVGF